MSILWGLLLASLAGADSQCRGSVDLRGASDAQISAVVETCQKDSRAQERNFLASWVAEQVRVCAGLNYGEEHRTSYLECVSKAVIYTEKVLTCTSSRERYQEAVEHDVKLLTYTFGEHAEVAVPASVQKIFMLLAKAAEAELGIQFSSKQWQLRGYAFDMYAASAGAGGRIVASSALWSGRTPLAEDEVAAILAHEISHVLREHSLQLGCLAVEWTGPNTTIGEASQTFNEDMGEGLPRKTAWSRLSQKLEYEADRLALSVLARAGYDPQAMARALSHLVPQSSGGFSRGSHPEMHDRIRAISEPARVAELRGN